MTLDPESVGKWAEIIDTYGALIVFAIISGIINLYFIVQLIRGKLVPHSLYKKSVDESDRLKRTMEKERVEHMGKILEMMGGLKSDEYRTKGGKRHGKSDGRKTT